MSLFDILLIYTIQSYFLSVLSKTLNLSVLTAKGSGYTGTVNSPNSLK